MKGDSSSEGEKEKVSSSTPVGGGQCRAAHTEGWNEVCRQGRRLWCSGQTSNQSRLLCLVCSCQKPRELSERMSGVMSATSGSRGTGREFEEED